MLRWHLICCPCLIIVHVRILIRVVRVRFLGSLAEALMIRISWVSQALLGSSLGSVKEFLGHHVRLGLIILLHRIDLVSYGWSVVLIMRTLTGKTNCRIVLRHDWVSTPGCILVIQRRNIILVSFSCTLIAVSRLLVLVEITPLEGIIRHLSLRRSNRGIIQVYVGLRHRLLLLSVLHRILSLLINWYLLVALNWIFHPLRQLFDSSSRA